MQEKEELKMNCINCNNHYLHQQQQQQQQQQQRMHCLMIIATRRKKQRMKNKKKSQLGVGGWTRECVRERKKQNSHNGNKNCTWEIRNSFN
jgi:hypothetical protein